MESHQLTEKELDIFCEVRKAHRLIYEYQRRMQDLTWYIKNKLDFTTYQGYKKFSAPIGDGKRIAVDNWSWDWIYSYVYEYHLGYNSAGNVRGSLIQVSDTGFFDQEKAIETNLATYKSPEESRSLLVFYLLFSNDKQLLESEWKPVERLARIQEITVAVNPHCTEIIYPIPLQNFLNEESTLNELRKVVDYCKEKTGIAITII